MRSRRDHKADSMSKTSKTSSNTSKSNARVVGVAAPGAADRKGSSDPMAAARSEALAPAHPEGPSEPAKQGPSSLHAALATRAETALERAGLMQPGGERAAAIRKATILANAAEIVGHFNGSVRLRTK
ncbi:hypothetical protein ACRAVF_17815 [Bradyrhizobium oligotrophicum S58]